jgi:hypothetical protein
MTLTETTSTESLLRQGEFVRSANLGIEAGPIEALLPVPEVEL